MYAYPKLSKQREQSMELDQHIPSNFFPVPPTIIFGSSTLDSPVVSFSGQSPLLPLSLLSAIVACWFARSQCPKGRTRTMRSIEEEASCVQRSAEASARAEGPRSA